MTLDGRDVSSNVTIEGNKMITHQRAKKAEQKSTKVNSSLSFTQGAKRFLCKN